MAYEVINNAQVTPMRVHALAKITLRLQTPKKQDVLDALQPPSLKENQSAAEHLYNAALDCGLIKEGSDKTVTSTSVADQVASVESFRVRMQQLLLGVTDPDCSNYRLNLYTSWYAVQDERVMRFKGRDQETRFNNDFPPDDDKRKFNMTKFPAWQRWAAFLGFGWSMKSELLGERKEKGGADEILVPNAYYRLKNMLPQIISEGRQELSFRSFIEKLAPTCPELDGGTLFASCWQASRGSELRGNRLSLMISAGLRQLHAEGAIELIRKGDAPEMWQLYPAESDPLREITSIRLRGA